MPGTWTSNEAVQRNYLENDPELNARLEALARAGLAYARSIAPVGSPADGDERPGQYRDSIKVVKSREGPGWFLFSDDNKAHWIEYGASHMPRFGVLTRASEQIRT